ncbi:hypothetical protein ACQ4PT_012188 [Festuca glaucescens]
MATGGDEEGAEVEVIDGGQPAATTAAPSPLFMSTVGRRLRPAVAERGIMVSGEGSGAVRALASRTTTSSSSTPTPSPSVPASISSSTSTLGCSSASSSSTGGPRPNTIRGRSDLLLSVLEFNRRSTSQHHQRVLRSAHQILEEEMLAMHKVRGFLVQQQLEASLTGMDLVIIPAGLPGKPEMTMDYLFDKNVGIV